MKRLKAVGLVAEYNPFHNGHHYHLQQARKISGADCVVAVMSGNFVQRGEPAIMDKWQRANEALSDGVDLVIELPVAFAVQPANRFAGGALTLLKALGVNDVVFGAEHPDWDFDRLVAAEAHFKAAGFAQFNATYATQFNTQLKQQTGHELTDPNDILAFGYYKENTRRHLGLNLYPIQRTGGDYHDHELTGQLSSGTAIRQAVSDGRSIAETVPEQTAADLANLTHVPTANDLYPLLRNELIQQTVERLSAIYSMSEGLEYRLKAAAEHHLDFQGYLKEAKTKRYTYAHLLRVGFYTVMAATQDQVEQAIAHPYLRILGFNLLGRKYLHQVKKQVSLPMITRVNRDLREGIVNLDYRAGKLYQAFTPLEQDVTRAPLLKGLSRKRR